MSGDLTAFYQDLVLSQRGEYGAYLDLGMYRFLDALKGASWIRWVLVVAAGRLAFA